MRKLIFQIVVVLNAIILIGLTKSNALNVPTGCSGYGYGAGQCWWGQCNGNSMGAPHGGWYGPCPDGGCSPDMVSQAMAYTCSHSFSAWNPPDHDNIKIYNGIESFWPGISGTQKVVTWYGIFETYLSSYQVETSPAGENSWTLVGTALAQGYTDYDISYSINNYTSTTSSDDFRIISIDSNNNPLDTLYNLASDRVGSAPLANINGAKILLKPIIFPNPVSNQLNFNNLPNDGNTKIEIYDVLGNLLVSKISVKVATKVDMFDLKNGIYLVKVTDGDQSYIDRIFKE